MKESLKAGIKHTHTYKVPETKTVPHVFEEASQFQRMPKVFATAFMVGLLEWACMEALAPYMEDDEISLGVDIRVSHLAATPPGMNVAVEATCTEVDGARTRWSLVARDEKDIISEGTHERFTIKRNKFDRIVEQKNLAT